MVQYLTIPVIGTYFDEIRAGTKLEEYRLIDAKWSKALEGRAYDFVVMTFGYPAWGDHSKRLVIPWRGFTKKTITHPHFGPDPVEVYAIDVSAAPIQTPSPPTDGPKGQDGLEGGGA